MARGECVNAAQHAMHGLGQRMCCQHGAAPAIREGLSLRPHIVFRNRRAAPIAQQHAASNHDQRSRCGCMGQHQLLHRIVQGHQPRRAQCEKRQIGGHADSDGACNTLQTQHP